MKRLFILILMVVMTSCSKKSPTRSDFEDPVDDVRSRQVPQISLVRMSGLDKSMVVADQPTISFDSIAATKTMNYLLMNNGTVDVFDVKFKGRGKVNVLPEDVGYMAAETSLDAVPVMTFTTPHVIPLSGVGALLPIEIGEFEDSLSLSYNFEATFDSSGVWSVGDTVIIEDNYMATGIKVAAVIDLKIGGLSMEEHDYDLTIISVPASIFFSTEDIRVLPLYYNIPLSDFQLVTVVNNGNVSLNMSLVEFYTEGFEDPDTTLVPIVKTREIAAFELLPDIEVDLTSSIFGSEMACSRGIVFRFGPSPYIFEIGGGMYINGSDYFLMKSCP